MRNSAVIPLVAFALVLLVSPAFVAAVSETNVTFGRSWPLSVVIDSARGVAYIDAESGDYPPTGFSFGVFNLTTSTFVKTLGLNGVPGPVALDGATGNVYVAGNGSVNVYDWQAKAFGTPLDVRLPIFDMVYDNVSRNLVVTSGGSVYQLSPDTGAILRSTKVGVSAQGIAIDWTTDEIYVADYLSASVSVLRGSDLSLVKTVTLPASAYPSHLVFDGARKEVFVAAGESSIFVLSTTSKTLVGTLASGDTGMVEASVISVDGRDGLVFVSSNPGNSVVEVDASTGHVVTSFPVNSTVYAMAFDRSTGKLFVTNYHQVTLITPVQPAPPQQYPLFALAGLAAVVLVAAAVAVYYKVVIASGGRRDGPASRPQKSPSSWRSSRRRPRAVPRP